VVQITDQKTFPEADFRLKVSFREGELHHFHDFNFNPQSVEIWGSFLGPWLRRYRERPHHTLLYIPALLVGKIRHEIDGQVLARLQFDLAPTGRSRGQYVPQLQMDQSCFTAWPVQSPPWGIP
jgi:hypothetical protein